MAGLSSGGSETAGFPAVTTGLPPLAFFRWQIATGADFIYHQTVGHKPPGTDLLNAYLDRVLTTAAGDATVNLALTRVQQLLSPPQSLLAPPIIARVLRGRHSSRSVHHPAAAGERSIEHA